jgi:fatty acid desaturase
MTRPQISRSGEIHALRLAVAAAGGFKKCPGRTTAKFAVHAVAGIVLYLGCLALPLWSSVALTPVCAMVLIVAVMMGHEAVHRAAYDSERANRTLGYLAFPLLSGLSSAFWEYKHNILHHNHPNSVNRDQDLEVLPFAIGLIYHRNSNRVFQAIQRRFQRGWMFWALSPLLPWDLRLRGSRYLFARTLRRELRPEMTLDVAFIAAHLILFLLVPNFAFGMWRSLSVYVGVWIVAGSWLALVGLVAHSGCPLIERTNDRLAQQFHTTRNVRLNRMLSWWFVGLDFQIEHHLFPQVSHFRLPALVPLVRTFARDHHLPYRVSGLTECLKEITAYFDRAWMDEAIVLSAPEIHSNAQSPVVSRT